MNKKQLVIACLVLLGIANTEYVLANNRYYVADFDNDKTVELFVDKFKKAVISKDKDIVASMIKYPVEANFQDKKVIISNAKEFIKLYDDVFNGDLVNKIASFPTSNMFANYQGVMLGNGEVWFGRDGNNIKIVAVGACRRLDLDYK